MRLPSASTCGPTLYLPLVLSDPDVFSEKMHGHGYYWWTMFWCSLINAASLIIAFDIAVELY